MNKDFWLSWRWICLKANFLHRNKKKWMNENKHPPNLFYVLNITLHWIRLHKYAKLQINKTNIYVARNSETKFVFTGIIQTYSHRSDFYHNFSEDIFFGLPKAYAKILPSKHVPTERVENDFQKRNWRNSKIAVCKRNLRKTKGVI